MVDGEVRRFSAGGLYDGLMLLVDDETKTFWNHITGDAVFGPSVPRKLSSLPVSVMRFDAARARYPGLTVTEGRPGVLGWALSMLVGDGYSWSGYLTSGFRRTMGAIDPRLPEQTSGLGVMVGGEARFYPKEGIDADFIDILGGELLRIGVSPGGFARAEFVAGGNTPPRQLLTRWYGFSATFPGCSIYRPTAGGAGSVGEN